MERSELRRIIAEKLARVQSPRLRVRTIDPDWAVSQVWPEMQRRSEGGVVLCGGSVGKRYPPVSAQATYLDVVWAGDRVVVEARRDAARRDRGREAHVLRQIDPLVAIWVCDRERFWERMRQEDAGFRRELEAGGFELPDREYLIFRVVRRWTACVAVNTVLPEGETEKSTYGWVLLRCAALRLPYACTSHTSLEWAEELLLNRGASPEAAERAVRGRLSAEEWQAEMAMAQLGKLA